MTVSAVTPQPFERLRTYASFVRFEHTLFSLPLILAGAFSVPGPPLSWTRWALIAVAAVGARSAAMALNRLIDRHIDALNPRTQSRELPSGRMKVVEAWALLLGSLIVYVLACAALGPWYLTVASIPVIVFALYPWLKRVTPLCHFGVGLALALAPLAGYAAAHPDLTQFWPAVFLSIFAFLWVSGFDIIYATLDEDFDRLKRLHSMVAWLGRTAALRVSAALHGLAFFALIAAALAVLGVTGPPYRDAAMPGLVIALTVAGVLLYLEQRWADEVDLAFFKVNVVVGFAVLGVILLARLMGGR